MLIYFKRQQVIDSLVKRTTKEYRVPTTLLNNRLKPMEWENVT